MTQLESFERFHGTIIIFGIWLLGALISLGRFIHLLYSEKRQLRKYRLVENTEIQKNAEYLLNGEATVMVTCDVDVPKVTGIKKAKIYLPPLSINKEELQYVLLHELQHIRGGDLFFKLGYCFLKAILWWNPIVHLFYRDLEELLEMRCDISVTKAMNKKERIAYLESILQVIRQVTAMRPMMASTASLVFLKSKKFIYQRFEVVLNQMQASKKRYIFLIVCIIGIAFLCSYCVMIQPPIYIYRGF